MLGGGAYLIISPIAQEAGPVNPLLLDNGQIPSPAQGITRQGKSRACEQSLGGETEHRRAASWKSFYLETLLKNSCN